MPLYPFGSREVGGTCLIGEIQELLLITCLIDGIVLLGYVCNGCR